MGSVVPLDLDQTDTLRRAQGLASWLHGRKVSQPDVVIMALEEYLEYHGRGW